jgi:hypothetical protein
MDEVTAKKTGLISFGGDVFYGKIGEPTEPTNSRPQWAGCCTQKTPNEPGGAVVIKPAGPNKVFF